jgi:phage-related protein
MRPVTWKPGTHWTVCTVEDAHGQRPVTLFLNGLEDRYEASKRGLLALLQHAADTPQGLRTFNADICHQIAWPIWQIKKGDLRLLWFYHGDRVVVCGHCFMKKSQKTPPKELAEAQRIYTLITGVAP